MLGALFKLRDVGKDKLEVSLLLEALSFVLEGCYLLVSYQIVVAAIWIRLIYYYGHLFCEAESMPVLDMGFIIGSADELMERVGETKMDH